MSQTVSRKKYRWFLYGTGVWMCVLLIHLHCNIDHGLEPIHSKIGGEITFIGDIPPRTDEVRVAVIKDFPPRAINELLFSDQIPFAEDAVAWEIYMPPGRYAAVVVVWKEKNQSWNLSDIIGLYGGTFVGDMLIPTYLPVTIPDETSVIDTVDIQANLNRVNRDAAIEGTVTFTGEWPQNTGIVGIGAFVDTPEPGNLIDYYFNNVALDYTIPLFVSEYTYRLRVASTLGTLGYVSVIWIDASFDLTSIKDIGFYRDPENPDLPGSVPLTYNMTTSGIDITVNFDEF